MEQSGRQYESHMACHDSRVSPSVALWIERCCASWQCQGSTELEAHCIAVSMLLSAQLRQLSHCSGAAM